MPQYKKTVRIVVASPGDVQAERDIVEAVAERLNRDVAADRNLNLEVTRWEVDAYPGFHPQGPQGQIDPVLGIADCDILVGIFWKRFGTPVADVGSGTEHEFRAAYEAWKRNQRPQIMVYFNQEKFMPASEDDLLQMGNVLKFKREFPREGLWWPYEGTAQFRELVLNHLTNYLRREIPLPAPIQAPSPPAPDPTAALERQAQGGDERAMTDLSLSGSPNAFDILALVLKSNPSEATREKAVQAIANLDDPRKVALLGKALVAEKWLVAAACAQTLGRTGNNDAIPYLLKAIKLKIDWLTVQKSAEALGFLEPTAAVLRALVGLLDSGTGSFEGQAAKQSLVKLDAAAVPALIDNLNRAKTFIGLDFTIQALDAIGDKRAVPALTNFLARLADTPYDDRTKEALRSAATHALEGLG